MFKNLGGSLNVKKRTKLIILGASFTLIACCKRKSIVNSVYFQLCYL